MHHHCVTVVHYMSRNKPCPCGSGKRRKHCCEQLGLNPKARSLTSRQYSETYDETGRFPSAVRGRLMQQFCSEQPPGSAHGVDYIPPGLLVVENFLMHDQCRLMQQNFMKRPSQPATVTIGDEASATLEKVRDKQRITEVLELGELGLDVTETVTLAYRDAVAPFFGAQLDTFSVPSVLKYSPGGKYDAHSDSEYWNPNLGKWIRSIARDYSLLLYVNDDYEGGSLYFPNFEIRLQPKRGMLVAFPSDHRYLHAADPLLSGERFVIVSWASDKRRN